MDDQRLLAVLTDAGLILPGEMWTVVAASGGLNTRVYRATRSGDDPGLSIRMFDAPANLERELAAIEEIAGCPGVPRVRFADDGILVHDYLPGRPRPLGDVDAAAIRRLCETLECIHRAQHDHYTHWPSTDVRHGARRALFRERCGALTIPREGVTGSTLERITTISKWLEAQPPASGSWLEARFSRLHGDLSYGNILWTEDSVGLIDWEYTRAGDPAEELAYLVTEQPVDGERLALIRDSYIAAGGGPRIWERVPPYAVFAALDSAIWWIDYLKRHGDDPAYHPEVEQRLDMAERWIARE